MLFAGLQFPFGVLDDERRLVSEVTLQRNSLGCGEDPAAFQAAPCPCCPQRVDPSCVTMRILPRQLPFPTGKEREAPLARCSSSCPPHTPGRGRDFLTPSPVSLLMGEAFSALKLSDLLKSQNTNSLAKASRPAHLIQ